MPFVPALVMLFAGGAVMGYATLAAGPIVGILSAFVVILILSRREQFGSYLAGFGLAGLIVLAHVILTCAAPSCHYAASTPIGAAGFALIALAGISLVGWAIAHR